MFLTCKQYLFMNLFLFETLEVCLPLHIGEKQWAYEVDNIQFRFAYSPHLSWEYIRYNS